MFGSCAGKAESFVEVEENARRPKRYEGKATVPTLNIFSRQKEDPSSVVQIFIFASSASMDIVSS